MYKNDSYSRQDETDQTNQGRLWKNHAMRMIEKDYPPWERSKERRRGDVERSKEMNYFRHGESASYRSRGSSSHKQERIRSLEDKGGSERLKVNSRIWEDYSRPQARERRDSSGDLSIERSRSRSREDEKSWERRSGAGERMSDGSSQRLQSNDNERRRGDVNDRGGGRSKRKKMQSVNEEEYSHFGRRETDTCFNNNRIDSRKRKPGRDLERIAVRRASSVEGYKCGSIKQSIKQRKRFVRKVIMSRKEVDVETSGAVSLERKGSKNSKNGQANDIISDFETLDLKQEITKVLKKKEVQYSQTFFLSGVASQRTKRSEKMRCRGDHTVSILKKQPGFMERLSCCFCQASHHEGAACPHLEENGTNPLVQRTGRKYKCSWCGSFNHFESSCPSTKEPIRDESLFLAACRASNNHRVVEGEGDSDEEEGIEVDYEDKEENREDIEEGEVVKGCTMDEEEGRKVDMEEQEQTSDTEEKVKEDTKTEQEEERKDYTKEKKEASHGSDESSQSVKMTCSDCKDQLMSCGICGGCSFSSHLQGSCSTSCPPASQIGEESAAGGGRRKGGSEDCGEPTDSDGSFETNELRDGCRWAESEDNLDALLLGGREENLTLEKSIVATPLILKDTFETSTSGEIFETSNNFVETSASDDNPRVYSKTLCSNTTADKSDDANDTLDTHSDTQTFQSNYASIVPMCNSPLENRSTIFDGKYPENFIPGPSSPKHRENTDASNFIPTGEALEIKTAEDRVEINNKSVSNSPVEHDNSSNPSNSSPQDIFNNEFDNILEVNLSVLNSFNPQLKSSSEQDSLCSDNSQVSLPKMVTMRLPRCENLLSHDTLIGSQQNIFESGGLDKNVTIEATPSVALEPSNEKSSLRVHSDEALLMSSEIVLEVVSAVLLVCRVNLTKERIKENVDSPSSDETNVLDCRNEVIIITLGEGDDDDYGVDKEKYNKPDPEVFHHKELRTNKTTQSPITKRMHEQIVSVMQGKTDLIRTQLITQDDLFTLTGLNWLNDQVVETYLNVVAERSMAKEYRAKKLPRIHCMSTYFFRNLAARGYSSVARWTKDVDLFSYDLILVPVLKMKHWALATVDFRTQEMFLYDSLVRDDKKIFSHTLVQASIMDYLQLEKDRMCQEAKDTRDKWDSDLLEPLKSRALSNLNLSQFSLHSPPCPQQENGSDCGVFVCQAAEYLSRGKPLNFGQRDVPYFRRKMTWEIIKNRILDEWTD